MGFLRKETYQLNFNFNSTTTEGAGCWIDENTEFLSKLDMKLPKIKHESDRILEIRTFIIQKYLDYQNLMDLLRLEWSDIYSTVFNCIQHRENSLIGRFILDSDNILPGDVIKEEMLKLHDNILEEVKSFKGTDLEK